MMRIGIFGGTFDPPHCGHLAIARAALTQLELDEVVFVPTSKNPFKQTVKHSSGRKRMRMLELMLDGEPGLSSSDIELTRGGVSYTVDTMQEFVRARPANYWFVMGSDALDGIYNWKQPERLLQLCRLAVALRPPHDRLSALRNIPANMHESIDFIELPPMRVSSTAVRDHVLRHLPPDETLKPALWDYIREQALYEEK